MGTRFHSMGTGSENPPTTKREQNTFPEAEYNDFVNNNKVSDERLRSIVKKILNLEELLPQELAIQSNRKAEIETLKKEIQRENTEPNTSEKDTLTPEEIEGLQEEKAQLTKELHANTILANSLEAQLHELQSNESSVPGDSTAPPLEVPASTSTLNPDKIKHTKEEIEQILKETRVADVQLKNTVRERAYGWSANTVQKNTEERLQREAYAALDQSELEARRKEYLDAYKKRIEDRNIGLTGIKKFANKIGLSKTNLAKTAHWFGFMNKDHYVKKDEDVAEALEDYNQEKDFRDIKVKDNFKTLALDPKNIRQYSTEKIAERANEMRAAGYSPTEIQAFEKRAKTLHERLVARENRKDDVYNDIKFADLEFVAKENKTLREEQQAVWEKNRNFAEKMIAKSGNWIVKNENIKNSVGQKWYKLAAQWGTRAFVFGATTSAIGYFSGAIGNPVFWTSRALRLAGSVSGGYLTKKISNWAINNERILQKRLVKIGAEYKNKEISASDYDTRREDIDRELNRWSRLKNILVVAGAYGGGAGMSKLDTHFHLTGNGDEAVSHQDKNDTHTEKTVEQTQKAQPVKSEGTAPTDTAKVTPPNPATPTQNPATPTETSATPTPTQVPIQNDWLVHKGEGIENTFIRQIEHSEELQKLLGYKEGMNLHDFAGKAAHQIALSNGYVDGAGHEVRITGAGIDKVAYEMRINNGAIEIHEHFDGKEIEMHDGHGTGIEKNIEDTKAEGGYETIHDGSHPAHTAKHIEALKQEINNAYPKPEPYHMDTLHPAPYNGGYPEPTPYKLGPNGITIHPINETPTIPTGNTPEPVRATPGYQPRLPHTHQEPRIYGDPMYDAPGLRAEPDAGYNQYLESQGKTSMLGGKSVEGNVATNTGMSFLDHLLKPFENIFNFDTTPTTPEIPNMTATPGGQLDDLSKAA